MNRIKGTVLGFFLSCIIAAGQNISSPYSSRDIGLQSNPGISVYRALGGTGIGMRSNSYINPINPASYTAQDTNSFLFDLGMLANSKTLQNKTQKELNRYVNFNNIALGFPLLNWWNVSIGIVPFSRVGYDVKEYTTESNLDVENYFTGDGGINELFFGTSMEFFNRLSIGLNASYLFGQFSHVKEKLFEDPDFMDIRRQNQFTLSDFRFTSGLQYYQLLNENLRLTAGIIYSNQASLNTKESFVVQQIFSANAFFRDTIAFTENTSGSFDLPTEFGGGLSLSYKNKLTIGVDYKTAMWEKIDNNRYYQDMVNSNTMHLGAEYIPNPQSIKYYWKRIRYRIGGFYRNSQRVINDIQLKDRGLSLGVGLPFNYSKTTFNFTYEFGKFATTDHGLIQENYNRFMINLTFHDFWFVKRKIK
jgi:hypothetical protein